jgi:hypothetical protein
MNNHIIYLEKQIYQSLKTITNKHDNMQMASIFELYTAIKLSEKLNKPFITWQKLTPKQKEKIQEKGYALTDKGCDGIDITNFNNFFQSKLYSENSLITWTKFSNFSSYKLLNNNVNLFLYRTPCKIDNMAQQIIKNGNVQDNIIDINIFLQDIDHISDKKDYDQETIFSK